MLEEVGLYIHTYMYIPTVCVVHIVIMCLTFLQVSGLV